jgi:hypothetical protein
MRIKVNGRQDKYALTLGIQTNARDVLNAAHFKAKAWAPSDAKSYSFLSLTHTDYHGYPAEEETGYATVVVAYFTRNDEGQYKVH